MLSAGSSLLCFAYDTCLHTCLLLNKFVLAIIIIAYLITHDKYITVNTNMHMHFGVL